MRLNFSAQGAGVPLIILHGFLGSVDNWRAMSKRLAAYYKVYCLDLRNHGASPHGPVMNYATMADDVREFCASENIQRAHLLGHSMGGKVAMQFTVDHPQSVAKLVVVDIAPKAYAPTHRPLLTTLSELDLSSCKTYGDLDRSLEGPIPEASLRQFLIKNLARGADQSFHWRIGLAEIIENYDELTQAIVTNDPIATPTCLIRAERSSFVTDDDIPAIRQMFPNAGIVTIANTGHWVHFDAADEFYRTVTEFLAADGR